MAYSYSVRAILPDLATRDEYLGWLRGGHVHAVVGAGARSAWIVLDDERPLEVETRYVFEDREAFRTYERASAPALRAEGAARFGSRATFSRGSGECFEARPRGGWAS